MATMLEMAREVVRFSFYDPPTVIAVGWAESRGNTNAVGVVTALRPDGSPLPWHGSRDRGVYQINSYFHPEVSDACAFSLACATKETYRISSAGRNMQPWNTFRTGAHVPFMADASVAYFLAVKEQQTGLPRRPDWWNQWIDKPNLPTIKLLDGPALGDRVRAGGPPGVRGAARADDRHVRLPHLRGRQERAALLRAEGGRGHRPQTWSTIHYLAKTKTRP